jgi:uncharacterized protein
VTVKPPRSFVDYSHETKVSKNPLLRYVWLGLGLISTGLGFLGYILPVMPGTVFILIAVYFFARSSPRFYNWLLNNPIFGQLIQDWRAGKGIPLKAKITAVLVMVLTMGFSIMVVSMLWVKAMILLCGVGVCLYILSRPSKIL